MFQDSPASSVAPGAQEMFDEPNSAAYDALQLLFGDWIKVIFNGSATGQETILSYVLGYMNLIALVFAVAIIGYVVLASVVKTAAEGEVLGKQWSSVWLPIRTAMSLGLILPVGAGGATTISAVQVIVIWLAMVGSNAADIMWRSSVEKLFVQQIEVGTAGLGNQLVMDLYRNVSCANGYHKGMVEDDVESAGPVIWFDDTPKTLNEANLSSLASGAESIRFGPQGQCGEIVMDTESDYLRNIAYETLAGMAGTIYQDIVKPLDDYTLSDIRTAINENRLGAEGVGSSVAQSVNKINELINGSSGYNATVNAKVAASVSQQTSSGDGSATVDASAPELGWFYAGAHWMAISNAASRISNGVTEINQAVSFNSPNGCKEEKERQSVFWGSWVATDSEIDDCVYISEFEKVSLIAPLYSNMNRGGASSADDSGETAISGDKDFTSACVSETSCSPDGVREGAAKMLAAPFSDAPSVIPGEILEGSAFFGSMAFFNGKWFHNDYVPDNPLGYDIDDNLEDGHGAVKMGNAIATISAIGHSIIGTAKNLFLGTFILEMAGGFVEGAGDSVVGLLGGGTVTQAAANVLYHLSDVFMYIFIAILPFGVMAAYLVPLMPALIWAAVVIGWLAMVVEAMAAAPLAVVQMATPEGEGISGTRLERGMALLAALVLRPSLAVVGLLAAMFLINIGFVLFNQIFFLASGNNIGSFDLIGIVIVIIIWSTAMVGMVKNVLDLIPSLSNNILEWFSGGIARTFGNDMAQSATAGFSKHDFKEMMQGYKDAEGNYKPSMVQKAMGGFSAAGRKTGQGTKGAAKKLKRKK